MGRRSGILVVVVVLIAIVAALAVWAYGQITIATAPDGPETITAPGDEAHDSGIPVEATDATIEYVHDGDTLFLTDGRKVRLLGVDTPEVGDRLECYGEEAATLLRSLLPEGEQVRVLPDAQPLDQYDRSLLLLWLDDGTLVNLELIQQGAAEAVVLEPNLLYAAEFEAAEDAAQAADLGLWGACR